MATVPIPITHQAVLPVTETPTLLYTVPSNVELATISIRVLNDTAASGNFSWWIVPDSVQSVGRQHRQQSRHPLGPGAVSLDMAYNVARGYRIFAAGSIDGLVMTINGIAHAE